MTENESKWTKALIEARWTCIPNVLIQRAHQLHLDPLNFFIITYIASKWIAAKDPPYVFKAEIAHHAWCSPRTIGRRIEQMEKRGLIRREARKANGKENLANIYHLDGLIAEATPLAKEMVLQRQIRTAQRAGRPHRMAKPKIAWTNPAKSS